MAVSTENGNGAVSCSQFCASYPGMTCDNADYALDNSGQGPTIIYSLLLGIHTYIHTSLDQLCVVDPDPDLPHADCDSDLSSDSNTQLCTCTFVPGTSSHAAAREEILIATTYIHTYIHT